MFGCLDFLLIDRAVYPSCRRGRREAPGVSCIGFFAGLIGDLDDSYGAEAVTAVLAADVSCGLGAAAHDGQL